MTKVTITITFLALAMLLTSYGQEFLPREREREIRTSGKYFYGECSAFNEADAIECAIKDLTQKVIIFMVQQSISSDAAKMQTAMEMKAKTATLSQTGRIRVLAWIEKDSVFANHTSEAAVQTPISVPEKATPITEQAPEPVTYPSYTSSIASPIARELTTCKTFEQFRKMADGFRRQGKLVYGANKASFVNPDNCFVAVFTSTQKLIALLDTGQGARKDLLTGNMIQNIEQHFAGNSLIWIQIRN